MTPIFARFDGVQESLAPGLPAFELWTLAEGIPGHPKHSTVSRQTIEAAGYCPIHTQLEEDLCA